MKKQTVKYSIRFESSGKIKLGGKTGFQKVVESAHDLSLKGIKEALKEQLDLAIQTGGEPYRPTFDDIEKQMGSSCIASDEWLKKQTKIYQKAYDLYDDIMTSLRNFDDSPADKKFYLLRDFKPFNMLICIRTN